MKFSLQNHNKIPVISSIKGVGDAVREKLRSSSSSLGDLYRSCRLEIVDIPVPTLQILPQKQQLQKQEQQCYTLKDWYLNETQKKILKEATILLGDSNLCAPLLLSTTTNDGLLKKIEWVQSTFAGVEPLLEASRRQQQKPTFRLTRAGGIMGVAMAQYVLGWIIALERKFLEAGEYQKQHIFAQEQLKYRPFNDLTVGILGFGDIGMEIGQLLKASGFRVIGFKRKIQVDTSVTGSTGGNGSGSRSGKQMHQAAHRVTENLQDVLEQSDYLVSCLPSTPATRHLLTTNLLTSCFIKKPVLINVGRGDLLQENTLIEALERQFLSRVVLDVFEKEPLPTESALWDHPKVIITPHIAAKSFPQDIAHVFIQNLETFLVLTEKQKLLYQVDWEKGY